MEWGAHLCAIMATEHGAHEVAEGVIAKVGADIRNAQPLSRLQWPAHMRFH